MPWAVAFVLKRAQKDLRNSKASRNFAFRKVFRRENLFHSNHRAILSFCLKKWSIFLNFSERVTIVGVLWLYLQIQKQWLTYALKYLRRHIVAITVKIIDLTHNLERGRKKGYTRLIEKHEAALKLFNIGRWMKEETDEQCSGLTIN